MASTASNTAKSDTSLGDNFTLPKEHNSTTKPNESPFTAFCKGLHLSPGPSMPSVSPNIFGKNLGGAFGRLD